jgi:hypothetical protein
MYKRDLKDLPSAAHKRAADARDMSCAGLPPQVTAEVLEKRCIPLEPRNVADSVVRRL